ncbi:TPA: hypothetical protein MIU83_20020 [Klebsiella pneumoniae]|uniref:hypothetical protein n=1 Tax=Enterobacteriaceae TaxID=543 RepID=UPI00092EFFDB|nr:MULTISPECIES: hypothetical protein [Enterobacteriaceae]ELQ9070575.1 hypothetical protein [Escherichia coli]MBC9384147.1 hypothetical protein [Escherichia coli]MBC9662007.1 hypothetical protein [Escherichia coli]UMD83582.1 hypothetical protein JJ527_01405 [Klebsiella pneumoniae]HAP2667870.1 hypothetical protein [Escherichia coli]
MNQASGICPQSDESLQSFILRVMLRVGWSDVTTLITHGGWGNNPSVPYEIKQDFDAFDASILLDLFENQYYVNKNHSLFDGRLSHISLFQETFFPRKKKTSCGGRVPLRFCRACIEKQLYERGFSYFKLAWFYETFCEIHATPLLKVKESLSLSKIRNILSFVLLADWPEILDGVSEEVLSDNEHYKIEELDLTRNNRILSFSPCAKKDLVEYFMSSSDYYPTGFASIADYGFLSKIQRDLLFKKRKRDSLQNHLEEVYEHESSNNYYSLMEHCIKDLEIIAICYFGKEHWVIKPNNRKCVDCLRRNVDDFRSCPAAGIISCTGGYLSSAENQCDKSLDNLESGVELHQRRLKVTDGERFVRDSIEKSRAITAAGGPQAYRREREARLKAAAKALDPLIL